MPHPVAMRLGQAYERARQIRVNVWSERMMDVAQDGSQDRDEKGRLNKEHILRSKLTVEAMQWQMSRLEPRRWAEKRLLNANLQTSVADMNEHQREAMVQQLLKRLEVIARPVIEERKRLQAQQAKMIEVTPEPAPAPVTVPKNLPR